MNDQMEKQADLFKQLLRGWMITELDIQRTLNPDHAQEMLDVLSSDDLPLKLVKIMSNHSHDPHESYGWQLNPSLLPPPKKISRR